MSCRLGHVALVLALVLPAGVLCQPVTPPAPRPVRLDFACVARIIHQRDLPGFRKLLEDPAAPKWTDGDGKTLLDSLAAASGRTIDSEKMAIEHPQPGEPLPLLPSAPIVEMARLVLAAGAEVDPVDKAGYTPLLRAAQRGGTEMISLLIQHEADVAVRAPGECTALHLLADQGSVETGELLLAAGADPKAVDAEGRTPLHVSARSGTTGLAKLLLDRGADVNAADKSGDTPLHCAVKPGPEMVLLLSERGANVNARNAAGQTPLHLAAGRGWFETARVLVAQGASLTITDADGHTPAAVAGTGPRNGMLTDLLQPPSSAASPEETLYRAILVGDVPRVRQCLKQGARADVPGKSGILPLWAAVTVCDEADLVHELVKAKAPLNALCGERHSPALIAAIAADHPHAAAALINAGADVKATGSDSLTALHLAAARDQRGLLTLLLDKGADLEAALYGSGQTPLHVAAKYGLLDVCKLLVARGANLSARDGYGRTPAELTGDYWAVGEYLADEAGKAAEKKPAEQ